MYVCVCVCVYFVDDARLVDWDLGGVLDVEIVSCICGCMYVCVHVCMHVCVCMCVCFYGLGLISVDDVRLVDWVLGGVLDHEIVACMCVCVCACMCVCVFVCMCVCAGVRVVCVEGWCA